MINFLIDNSLALHKYQESFERRKIEGYVSPNEKYVLRVEHNRMWINPLMAYQCDVKAFSWEVTYNILTSYRMEPIISIDEVHQTLDTLHMLLAKLMVLDIPDDKITQAIQALHQGYKPTYKVTRNYLTDGLMFRWTGEDPEELKRFVSLEEYLWELHYSLTEAKSVPIRVEGRDYGPQPRSIHERLEQAKLQTRP